MKHLQSLVTMTFGAVALTVPIAIALAVSVIVFRAIVSATCGAS